MAYKRSLLKLAQREPSKSPRFSQGPTADCAEYEHDAANQSVFSSPEIPVSEEYKDDRLLTMMFAMAGSGSNADLEFDPNLPTDLKSLVSSLELQDTVVSRGGMLSPVTLGTIIEQTADFGINLDKSSSSDRPSVSLSRSGSISATSLKSAEDMARKKGVLGAIQQAAMVTGADYGFMVMAARQESGFNARSTCKTSTGAGLYGFLESSWRGMVTKHGDVLRANGFVNPSDPALRFNPLASALMGAELYLDNKRYLERSLHHQVGASDVYLAHFLGAGGAAKFFRALEQNPDANASALFVREAAANRSVFSNRTLAEVRHFMASKIEHPAPALA